MRIVLADDSKPTRLFIKRILVDAGHDVVGVAENGKDALELCKQYRPDVAMLDRTMPGLGGEVVAREVLDNRYATQVIMISLDAQLPIFEPLKARGVKVLGKPCRKEQIEAALAGLYHACYPGG